MYLNFKRKLLITLIVSTISAPLFVHAATNKGVATNIPVIEANVPHILIATHINKSTELQPIYFTSLKTCTNGIAVIKEQLNKTSITNEVMFSTWKFSCIPK